MSRILFVGTSTTVGGAEKTLFTLATSLDPARHSVAGVVSLKPEGEYARRLRESGVKVETLGLTGSPRPWHARRLAAIIEREKPDIVHALMFSAIQLARMAKPLSGVPFKLVSSPRVSYRTRPGWTLMVDRWLKRRDDLLIAECDASRAFLLTRLAYEPSKVIVIRNGVEAAGAAAPRDERNARRAALGVGEADVFVGAMGRLDAQKGFSTLIAAMGRLKGTVLRCAILGEGPLRGELEMLIRLHGLDKTVSVLGEKRDAAAWLSTFDVFCLPSLWEGLPNALLEAMARGLPVVASNVDGVPEAIADGSDGLLTPPDDAAALAAALKSLAADPARRAALGAAGKAAVAERFTLGRMIGDYERAYDAVLSS